MTRRNNPQELDTIDYKLAVELNKLKNQVYRYEEEIYLLNDWRDRESYGNDGIEIVFEFLSIGKNNSSDKGRLTATVLISNPQASMGVEYIVRDINWLLASKKIEVIDPKVVNSEAFKAIYL